MKLIPEEEYFRLLESSKIKPNEIRQDIAQSPEEAADQESTPSAFEPTLNNFASNRDNILSLMSKRIRLRVSKLLDLFDSHSDIINVNHSAYPLIKINNSLIPQSNCIKLIKFLYSNSKKSIPTGYYHFITALKSLNANPTFISLHKPLKRPPRKLAKYRKLY